MRDKIKSAFNEIKNSSPLILNLTNYVTVDFVANGLLALGASPIMSYEETESSDLVKIAKAIVINLGTLNEKFINHCKKACAIANINKIPIILDPVGSGASKLRTNTSLNLLNEFYIDIVRGNASEIMSLTSHLPNTKGVDSTLGTQEIISNAQKLSEQHNCTVVVSGKIDFIFDKNKVARCHHGSNLMPKITGTGCLLTAVIGAFRTVEKNNFIAATIATHFYGLCAELAAATTSAPASFKNNFLDFIYKGLE